MNLELVIVVLLLVGLLVFLRRRLPVRGRRRIRVNAEWRTYSVFEPRNAAAGRPVLLCFHGGSGNAERFRRGSGIKEAALARGYVAVFPEAPDGWIDARRYESYVQIRAGDSA